MTGSLRHLGGDRYQAVIYAGLDVLGKPRQLTRVYHAANGRAANKALPGHVKALQDRAAQVADSRGTVGELADRWLKAKRVRGGSPATFDGIRPHVASIKKHLGALQVDQLSGEHVDAWLEVLRTEKVQRVRSEATIHHYYATLRTMLRWARRKRIAVSVATEFADAPAPRRYEHRPPTAAAVGVVLAAASGDVAVALELLVASGMRRGELVGLRWTDLVGTRLRIERALVEVDGGGVVVKPPKGGNARSVSLTPETVQLLHDHHASLMERSVTLRDDAYMFPALRLAGDGSEPHRPTWLNSNWARLKKTTGHQFRLHDLRHTHASMLLLGGVPMSVVSHRLGHSKESTTSDIYSHVLDDNDDMAAAIAQKALGRG